MALPTRTIYCDESGFTGHDLLDPNQPRFPVGRKVFPVQAEKFPVPLRREFDCNALNLRAQRKQRSAQDPEIIQIPC
jgi:hypothetical protein